MSEKDKEAAEEQPVETGAEQEAETDPSAEPEADATPEPVNMKGFAILQIITWTHDEIDRCREKLETEPSSRELAFLQGKIPGCKFALKAIEEIFSLSDEFLKQGEKPCKMSSLTQEQILGAEKDMEELQESEQWQQFLVRIQERTEVLKDFLLFEANKSRDMDVHQGEYKGMITYKTVFNAINDSASFWRDSLFKKKDDEAETRNANDPAPALLPPGLPAPENAEDAEIVDESGADSDDIEIDYDDYDGEDEVDSDSLGLS
jgi:hypothetical protein